MSFVGALVSGIGSAVGSAVSGIGGALGTVTQLAGVGVSLYGSYAQSQAQRRAADAQDRAYKYNQTVALRNAQARRHQSQMDFMLRSHDIRMNRAVNETNYAWEERRLAWERYRARVHADMQAKVHDANARNAEIEAAQAAQRTNEQTRRIQERGERRMALQRARAGASGVIGPIAILGQESEEAILQEMTDQLYRGNLERHGHIQTAEVEKWRSKLARAEGELAQTTIGFDDFAAKQRFSLANMRLNLERGANKAAKYGYERTYEIQRYAALNAPNPSGATRAAADASLVGGVGDAIGSVGSIVASSNRQGSSGGGSSTYYNTDLTSPNVAFPVNNNQPSIP